MSHLFDETKINGLILKNRIIRSATHEGLADDNGCVTDELLDFIREVAGGGAGLLISGHAYVSQEGKASPRQLAVHSNECIHELTTLAKCVHDVGSTIVLQLAHAGCASRAKISGEIAQGPSAVYENDELVCREMNATQIETLVASFAQAAGRAKECGFDGVQIHAAHGYCLSQFLSPYYNKRKDSYGGSLANRARIVVAVVKAVRTAVGPSYPVFLKINSEDFLDNGFRREEMYAVADMLADAGINAIELSGGTIDSPQFTPIRKGEARDTSEEGYYREAAKNVKQRIAIPVMMVGGIRSMVVANELITHGVCDYVCLSRPLIRQPNLVKQWSENKSPQATCISCNMCFRPLMTGKGLYCVVERKMKEKT